MDKCFVYHGTSDVFLPKILKEGFLLPKYESQYDEVRCEFSKYVSPDVLTDAFFDNHIDRMPSGRDCGMSPGLRVRQIKRGAGIFCSNTAVEPQRYAHSTVKNGGGEFERNILGILESIPAALAALKEEEQRVMYDKTCPSCVKEEIQARQEMYHLLQDNIKPEFLNEQGQFQPPPIKPYQKAVVFEIETDGINQNNDYRLKESVSLSQIKRIGYANTDEYAPVSFLPVEDFLKREIEQMKKGENLSYNPEEVLNVYHQRMHIENGMKKLSIHDEEQGKSFQASYSTHSERKMIHADEEGYLKTNGTPTGGKPMGLPSILSQLKNDLGVPTSAPNIPNIQAKEISPSNVPKSPTNRISILIGKLLGGGRF